MVERLTANALVRRNEVNPDSIMAAIQRSVGDLEASAERRDVALDWNGYRLAVDAVQTDSAVFFRGDLRIQSSVPVL